MYLEAALLFSRRGKVIGQKWKTFSQPGFSFFCRKGCSFMDFYLCIVFFNVSNIPPLGARNSQFKFCFEQLQPCSLCGRIRQRRRELTSRSYWPNFTVGRKFAYSLCLSLNLSFSISISLYLFLLYTCLQMLRTELITIIKLYSVPLSFFLVIWCYSITSFPCPCSPTGNHPSLFNVCTFLFLCVLMFIFVLICNNNLWTWYSILYLILHLTLTYRAMF